VVRNNGTVARTVTITQTLGGHSTSMPTPINPGIAADLVTILRPLQLTPGENLDIQVLDNAKYGSTVYGDGDAFCFTDDGVF
jgi:hypothetical protein